MKERSEKGLEELSAWWNDCSWCLKEMNKARELQRSFIFASFMCFHRSATDGGDEMDEKQLHEWSAVSQNDE